MRLNALYMPRIPQSRKRLRSCWRCMMAYTVRFGAEKRFRCLCFGGKRAYEEKKEVNIVRDFVCFVPLPNKEFILFYMCRI